jgi:hypothetical protein
MEWVLKMGHFNDGFDDGGERQKYKRNQISIASRKYLTSTWSLPVEYITSPSQPPPQSIAMSRLASLTPSRTRSRASQSPSPSPAPTVSVEATHHRMLKLVLAEVRNTIRTWDELVGADGVKAGKGCVDEGTTME